MNKTFLLGLGAQKSGTTWTFDYLRSCDEVNFGFMKEYHILDAHFVPLCKKQEKRKKAKFLDAEKKVDQLTSGKIENIRNARAFYDDLDKYFDYFKHLIAGDSGKSVTGDLTPTHSALEKDHLEYVDESFARRGFEVKAIQLVRDPVERLISAVRMRERNKRRRNNDNSNSPTSLHDELLGIYRMHDHPQTLIRSNYKDIREAAKSVFENRYMIIFYEELFEEETVRGICDFLGVSYRPPNFDKFVNPSRTKNEIPDRFRRSLFGFYKEQYDYFVSEFGERKIGSVWQTYRDFCREDKPYERLNLNLVNSFSEEKMRLKEE